MIYVTSDLHLGHKHIVEFEQASLKANGLTSVVKNTKDWDRFILERINNKVKPDDLLYILGDFAFGTTLTIKKYLDQINCKVIIILGNHDRYNVKTAVSTIGFYRAYRGAIYLPDSDGRILLSHMPLKEGANNPFVICLHGHIHNFRLKYDNFYNVGIGANNFEIQPLEQYTKKMLQCKNRWEPFGSEWYINKQIPIF